MIEEGRFKGKPLGLDSVLGYLGCAINLAKAKFSAKASDKSKLFLSCLDKDSTSEAGQWLRGLKKRITRDIFEKSVSSGEEFDHSADPIYLEYVRLMVTFCPFSF